MSSLFAYLVAAEIFRAFVERESPALGDVKVDVLSSITKCLAKRLDPSVGDKTQKPKKATVGVAGD